MKTQSKIILANISRNAFFLIILFLIPLTFSTRLYNSFRLPKTTLFIIFTLLALFFSIMYFLEKKSINLKRYKFILGVTAVLLILKFLSWFFSENRDISFWGDYTRTEGFLLWIFFILFFVLLLLNDWTKQKIRYYAFAIVMSATLMSLYGYLQKFGLIQNIWSGNVASRIISTMGNPLNFSAFIILTIPFFYYCIFFYKNIFIKIITGAGYIITVVALYFSGSRSSWIAFLFANFVIFTFYFFKRNKKAFLALLILGVILASSFTYIGINKYEEFSNPALKRLFSIFNTEDNSNKQRLLFWQGSFDAFKDRPVFGWGQDFLGYAFDKNFPPKLSDLPETNIDRAHNWHLDVLVMEGGLVWVLTMAILLFATWKSIKLLKRKDKEKASVGLIFIYLMAACLLQFFFMFALISPHLIIIFALAVIYSQSYTENENTTSIIRSNLLEKLKKNSNLYLVIGIGMAVFVAAILMKPVLANKEFTKAVLLQEEVQERMEKSKNTFPSHFYKQQHASLHLKYANEARVSDNTALKVSHGGKASIIFKELVEQYPSIYSNYIFLAESYDLYEKYELTDETFQKAVDNFPTRHDIYWKWAGFLGLRDETEKAIEIFNKAIEIDPEVALPYYKLSIYYRALEDVENADKYRDLALDKGLLYRNLSLNDKKYLKNLASEETKATNDEVKEN